MSKRDLVELTDEFTGGLIPIAPDAPDVCPVCRAGRGPRDDTCFSCGRTMSQVALPCEVVIPISYYTKPEEGERPSPFRDAMHGYKEDPDPARRAEFAPIVGGTLARYLLEHGEALADVFGPWDEIVAVPSTKSAPPSALARILSENFTEFVQEPAEWLAKGPGQMKFLQASETGFVATTDVEGAQVLLIDDTFTTGARTQSAAHVLQAAGAEVVVAMTVSRKVRVTEQYNTIELWERQTAQDFSFTDLPWWAA
jgi:predicted amidophosphoribosyltransferase